MRLPERLDAIDEADESRPLLGSAPPMPSSRIDRRSGAASASISRGFRRLFVGASATMLSAAASADSGNRRSISKCTSTGTVQRRASILSAGPSSPCDRIAG